MTGTIINVGAVLAGTGIGLGAGTRLTERLQQRVLAGLGLVTLVIGVQLALAWNGKDTTAQTPLYVLGAILLGGLVGELLDLEGRIESVGDGLQARLADETGESTLSEGFVTASLLFCVGSLAVVGSIQDGLTGDWQTLATKAVLDGFAAVALAASLGWGVGLSAISILVYQGAITLGAGALDGVLQGEALAALTSAGGVTIIGIAMKLLAIKDVRVANFLPALLFAPLLVGLGHLIA
ncbi:MAG: uncharacterized protein QOE86_1356 [Solirubrobacteraceae bacterium]|jgi:uncharacterized membrane protein YqgA involved in biofilm formation|nr:uncharacterized protein [Solirubrobacteraceae bacterium]